MPQETTLKELKINYLSEDQYKEALDAGNINENEIYITPYEPMNIATESNPGVVRSGGDIDVDQNGLMHLTAKSIIQKETFLSFPAIGNNNTIYIDTSDNSIYRFSEEELKYYLVTSDWNNIKTIDGTF